MKTVVENIFFGRDRKLLYKKPVQIRSIDPHIICDILYADIFVVVIFDIEHGLLQIIVFQRSVTLCLVMG